MHNQFATLFGIFFYKNKISQYFDCFTVVFTIYDLGHLSFDSTISKYIDLLNIGMKIYCHIQFIYDD